MKNQAKIALFQKKSLTLLVFLNYEKTNILYNNAILPAIII